MAEYDEVSDMKIAITVPMLAHAAAVTAGTTVDTKGFEAATIIFASGTITAGTADFTVQEAPDNGSGAAGAWTDVAAVNLIGTVPTIAAGDDDKVSRVGYRGKSRFIRVNMAETVTFTSHIHSVLVALGAASTVPVTAQLNA
tara:strand:- start:895 stop:1320 length:426 start_codon:yes stop_codon:yes gene_type:complete